MPPIEFFIPHAVQAKQGDHARIATAKDGQQFVAHHPRPKAKKNAAALTSLFVPYVPVVPLAGPLRMDLLFQFPWRKSEPQRNRHSPKPKDTRPDCDNLCKQMLDVMQDMGFFTNDWQVADVRIRKVWTDSPGVHVKMEELE